ncbi:MAG: bifunctional phosphoglucose/phosphomannose isomerase [Bacteroidota bacterium]
MNITEMVSKYDQSNQFKVLKESFKQVEYAWNLDVDLKSINTSKIKNIIVTGLGGSAIGGDLMSNFSRKDLRFPYAVNRNYELPGYANEETLVVASSYSGNTEETISALNNAVQKKCQIVCITTGGKIEEIAKSHGFPAAKLQPGFQPRYALWINFFTLLKIFHTLKLVPDQTKIVKQVIDHLKTKGEEYSKEKNEALQLAEKLAGFIPLVYAVADYTSVVAARLKGQFNENSKLHAFYSSYPELDHNEIMGWESFGAQKMNLKLINILDKEYHPQVSKRFQITSEIIEKSGCEIISLESKENDFRLRLIDLIYLGDWATYYLAVLRSFDPTSIGNINYLKEHL